MDATLSPDIGRLLVQLKSADPGDRRMAAIHLGKLGCREEQVRAALEAVALNDQDYFAQYEALYALKALGFPNPIPDVFPDEAQSAVPALGHGELEGRLVEGKGFAIRAGAWIIDIIINNLIGFAIIFTESILVGVALAIAGRAPVDGQSNRWLGFGIALLLTLFNPVIFEWLYGATPGKLILGMRVVLENGAPCSLGAALIRGLLRFIDGLFFGIPAYLAMKAHRNQRIGDKFAKTIVVSAKDPVIQRPRAWWWFLIASIVFLVVHAIIDLLSVLDMLL